MLELEKLLRRLKNKLFGIRPLKTGTGVFTVPAKGHYHVTGAVTTSAGMTQIDESLVLYDVPTRRSDEPVGGKNAKGRDLTPLIHQTADEYKFWQLTNPRLCHACVLYKGPILGGPCLHMGNPCLHTCTYCGYYSTKHVECAGIFHCGNLLCTSSGGAWFRYKLKSFQEASRGNSLSGRHTVDVDEWKQAAMRYLEEHPGEGYVAVWKQDKQ